MSALNLGRSSMKLSSVTSGPPTCHLHDALPIDFNSSFLTANIMEVEALDYPVTNVRWRSRQLTQTSFVYTEGLPSTYFSKIVRMKLVLSLKWSQTP